MEAHTYIYPRSTHFFNHSIICPHNALVSKLKLFPGFRAFLIFFEDLNLAKKKSCYNENIE